MGRAEDIFEKIINDGEPAIDEFILTRKSEELFLDFKRSSDNGSGKVLNQKDRENLAKAISGFGNSEGGVIVWGIYCSKDTDHADVAHTKFPIQNIQRFASWIEGSISGCTIPPHIEVRNHYIISDNNEGFLITLIPKSVHIPHQTVGSLKYFIRAGSNFVPTPHAVLAGMFGRRPQPHVFHMFVSGPAELVGEKIKIEVGFLIANKGPGIASDLFLNILILSIPGDNCKIYFNNVDTNNWEGNFSFGINLSLISKINLRSPPESKLQPCVMNFYLAPPFLKKLKIDCICGCGQSSSLKFLIERDTAFIENLYNDFIEKNREGLLTEEDKFNFVNQILDSKIDKKI